MSGSSLGRSSLGSSSLGSSILGSSSGSRCGVVIQEDAHLDAARPYLWCRVLFRSWNRNSPQCRCFRLHDSNHVTVAWPQDRAPGLPALPFLMAVCRWQCLEPWSLLSGLGMIISLVMPAFPTICTTDQHAEQTHPAEGSDTSVCVKMVKRL